MSDRTIWKRTSPKRHSPTELRQVSSVRVVGFQDAVEDLGTHKVCGHEVHYSRGMVFNVLKGLAKSNRMLELIASKRPDLFLLHYVCHDVREWAFTHVAMMGDAAVAAKILDAGCVAGIRVNQNKNNEGAKK